MSAPARASGRMRLKMPTVSSLACCEVDPRPRGLDGRDVEGQHLAGHHLHGALGVALPAVDPEGGHPGPAAAPIALTVLAPGGAFRFQEGKPVMNAAFEVSVNSWS